MLKILLNRYSAIAAITLTLLTACGGGGGGGDPVVTPPATNTRLSVQVLGVGSVVSLPAGLNCTAACGADFELNTTVTLTATPASGQVFEGWSGACTGAANTCVVSMDPARVASVPDVTAVFTPIAAPTSYTFGLTISGSGTVVSQPAAINCSASCNADVAADTVLTLTATPAANQSFAGWSGACTGAAASCSVTMSQARTVGATFEPITAANFALTVSVTGSGSVVSGPAGINCGSACSANFAAGTTVTLSATPAAGQMFSNWTGACTGAQPTCTLQLTQVRTTQAVFAATPVATAFQAPQLLESSNDFNVGNSRVAVNRHGDAIAIWEQPDGVPNGTTQKVYSRRYQAATGWQAAVAVTDLSVFVNHISGSELLLDDAGVATWIQGNNGVETRRNSATTGWGAVFSPPNPRIGTQLSAAMDANGNIRLLRSGSDVESNTLPAGGTWGAWVPVDNAGSAVSHRAKIAQSADGTALAVWRESNPGDNNRSMKAARYTPAAGWSTPESIETLFTNVEDADPSVAIDDQGNGVAMWQQAGGLYSSVYRAGSGWQGAVEVTGQIQALPNAAIQLAMTPDGRAVATWFVGGGLGTLRGMQYSLATGWSAPVTIGGSNTSRKMSIDSNGQAVMAYMRINATTAKWDLVTQRLNFGGAWSAATEVESAGGNIQNSTFAMNRSGQGIVLWSQDDSATTSARNSMWSAVLR